MMIREATERDLDQIEEIVGEAKQVMAQAGLTQWGETYPLREHYEKDLHNQELYVFEQDQQIIGVACISNKGHEEYHEIAWSEADAFLCLKRVAVSPQARQKGVGLAFYEYAEQLAAQRDIPYIRTDTNGENEAALRLFQKGNYTLVDKQYHGQFPEPFYYYEKKIHSS
ncbi:GNAT family N-acetyltransferase [Alkalibacillus almallahensis]|uniref:GNAT family N-acetyltransferase n=1 Tax=Alkalibacillus almallahensis TaxID=1379154 RepID=UPI001422A971|nr:GNAT family N-acetyltransferase [Alkalibacillus almallahensis]NIK11965.1 ribosomal protein S18 acetylase RimI-like enzyme [Alkalibacillus almallahensis]